MRSYAELDKLLQIHGCTRLYLELLHVNCKVLFNFIGRPFFFLCFSFCFVFLSSLSFILTDPDIYSDLGNFQRTALKPLLGRQVGVSVTNVVCSKRLEGQGSDCRLRVCALGQRLNPSVRDFEVRNDMSMSKSLN